MKIGASYMCRVIHWPIRLFSVRKAKTYTFEPALSVPAHGPLITLFHRPHMYLTSATASTSRFEGLAMRGATVLTCSQVARLQGTHVAAHV